MQQSRNSSGPNRPSSNNNRKGGYNRNKMQAPKPNKGDAVSYNKPHYLKKEKIESLTYKQGIPKDHQLTKTNTLPVKSISKSQSLTVLKSNSPKTFNPGKPVRVIPMGGLNEVGLNMTAIECGDDIFVIDTGFGFGGGDRFPGVDYIIPDTGYLEQNRHKIRGLIYTHGHLDHIGGAPYILPKLGNIPIFGTEFALELVKNRLSEFGLDKTFKAKVVGPGNKLKLGVFEIELFRLNHSIPDVVGLAIDTPMGKILYTTDWRFDHTPFDNEPSDYAALSRYGEEGVRLLMTDSLGILKKGASKSDKDIEESILDIFEKAEGKIVFTSFSSHIARMQQVINATAAVGRKLSLVGRSMENNFDAAFRLGKIKVPKGLMIDVRKLNSFPSNKLVVLGTGSQGEDAAALSRMARGEHRWVKLESGDCVVFSGAAIPGNEDSVQNLKSTLSKKGVDIYDEREYDIYASGHATIEDLKLLFALTKPDNVQPIHGEHYLLVETAKLAAKMGVPHDHCLVGANGRITTMDANSVKVTDDYITDKYVLVDGSGVGAVSEVVLDERRTMGKEGVLMLVMLINRSKKLVSGPEIISRGFVYMKNSKELFDDIKQEMRKKYSMNTIDPKADDFFPSLRKYLKDEATQYIYNRTEKMPMVIPVVVQV